jgi:cGMP-dependent protein kinase
VLTNLNRTNYTENKSFIDNLEMFTLLTKRQKENLISSLSVHSFNPGDRIVTEGESGYHMYIIKDGNVSCT